MTPVFQLNCTTATFFALILLLSCIIKCYSIKPCSHRDNALSKHNQLLRVDNIAPTCYQRPNCVTYKINSVVLSVDKSLPYLGSSSCCFTFQIIDNETSFNDSLKYKTKLMAHISEKTVLKGNDYISFSSGSFQKNSILLGNMTANNKNNYMPIYIPGNIVTIEFNKDIDYRSVFEIMINTFYESNSLLCDDKENFFRCGDNTSHCVDNVFLCDHYHQCPNGADEALDCESHEAIKSLTYDRMTVLIVFMILIAIILLIIALISLLCIFQSKDKISGTFISIFGNRDLIRNGDHNTKYTLLDPE